MPVFLLWVRFNIPEKHDLTWFANGGDIFRAGVHSSPYRFHACQKLIFLLQGQQSNKNPDFLLIAIMTARMRGLPFPGWSARG